jgi:4-hydroxy-3-polyprenylbenzoate decarboxylase
VENEPVDRLIIGISGASGVQYGVRVLELLKPLPIETHLIMSKSAELTVHHELDQSVEDIRELADVWYPVRNVGASGGQWIFPHPRYADGTLLNQDAR